MRFQSGSVPHRLIFALLLTRLSHGANKARLTALMSVCANCFLFTSRFVLVPRPSFPSSPSLSHQYNYFSLKTAFLRLLFSLSLSLSHAHCATLLTIESPLTKSSSARASWHFARVSSASTHTTFTSDCAKSLPSTAYRTVSSSMLALRLQDVRSSTRSRSSALGPSGRRDARCSQRTGPWCLLPRKQLSSRR